MLSNSRSHKSTYSTLPTCNKEGLLRGMCLSVWSSAAAPKCKGCSNKTQQVLRFSLSGKICLCSSWVHIRARKSQGVTYSSRSNANGRGLPQLACTMARYMMQMQQTYFLILHSFHVNCLLQSLSSHLMHLPLSTILSI